MLLAFTSFVIVFGIFNICFLLSEYRSRKAEMRLVHLRVIRHEAAPGAETTQQPPVIRSSRNSQRRSWAGFLSTAGVEARLSELIERAGLRSTPASVLKRSFMFAGMFSAPVLVFAPGRLKILAIAAVFAGAGWPLRSLLKQGRKRLEAFEAQFPDALEFVSRSMRAGHAFSVSLEMLYREFEEPLSGEFRRIFEEQNLGLPLESALTRFSRRIPLIDVQFFVSAVVLQRRTGGNLTEILDNLAKMIRERYKLRGKIKAASAHGQMTGRSLSAIPVFIGVMMCVVNKSYAHFFTSTPTGWLLFGISVGLQLLGYLVIRQIVKIEV
jgi:tight adherence protein B